MTNEPLLTNLNDVSCRYFCTIFDKVYVKLLMKLRASFKYPV